MPCFAIVNVFPWIDSDNTEYDYQYGEEKEDSDTESGGNSRNAK